MLQIFNSLTRKKATFSPITPGQVRLYVCGMTVYDYCHLGHARVMVVFDTVVRYLRDRGFKVTYIRNITDIDDKIINRARENGEDIGVLTERFIQAMNEDANALGVLPPDAEPRATVHMPHILEMIEKLLEKGYAYTAKNGDVYYRVRKFKPYGALSGKTLDELKIGARVEVGEDKDDPLDFVLWKAAKPGEPQWDSAWGPGRPGWHIECSAMSTVCLGNHFDIHGGGMDLKFPHHENEIAQSEAATGKHFVNTWMHVGFVQLDKEKMSKSLGNFFTVREVLKQFDPEVIRYFILGAHYRSPLDYSNENLDDSMKTLVGFYIALRGIPKQTSGEIVKEHEHAFCAAMDDDFNTPKALAVLSSVTRALNTAKSAGNGKLAASLANTLRYLAEPLGLLQGDPEKRLQGGLAIRGTLSATLHPFKMDMRGTVSLSDDQIEKLIQKRSEARKNKDWAESDHIRDELKAQGVILEDTAGQTTWRRQ
ncbi:MAG: cysteine--tRNA ligase [Gammaproteobacteria bacterium]|nr:cysteine--tRNA ligase [Gammaproteobacteria bacterium]MDH3371027.1 cysteine--tRNA ligase [Gammaproteobacteria bacterium]MDH3406282.1 cysteine--tRNA ligase [Gammaproteobacteria bacterium]MDH3562186.1 cysteine--tRNA ligase [Gammaproteobacteria bacterium]MDH5487291.1 cysteine--tRNA ligase [Gammaproteobacteria bacterium]